jgi:hypothetical protein
MAAFHGLRRRAGTPTAVTSLTCPGTRGVTCTAAGTVAVVLADHSTCGQVVMCVQCCAQAPTAGVVCPTCGELAVVDTFRQPRVRRLAGDAVSWVAPVTGIAAEHRPA